MNIFQTPLFTWGITLVIVIPILIIFFSEIIERLRRRESPYAEIFSLIRDAVLPLMATLIVMRLIFVVEEQNLPARIISTIFWSLLILVIFRFTRNVIGAGEYDDDDWRTLIPHMFLRLPPYTIMGYVVFHIIQDVWALPVREMATTLGIGSIVIAFALQDTLSNLVSGLLLVANSPFKTGEWIKVGDAEGKVISVNWRYTSIETWNSDLIVIPNGAISEESIENFSRPTGLTVVSQEFELGFSNSPNSVREMLTKAMLETPGILSEPPPFVALTEMSVPLSKYLVEFFIDDYGQKSDIHGDLMTRVWYATQRSQIDLPNVYVYDKQKISGAREISAEVRTSHLQRLSNFSILPADVMSMLGESSAYKRYASAEKIVEIGAIEAGLYVVSTGTVTLSLFDEEGDEQVIKELSPGDFFGETGLFSRAISPVLATSETDTEILIIPHEIMNGVINRNPQFSTEVNALINQRRVAEERATQTLSETEMDESALFSYAFGINEIGINEQSETSNGVTVATANEKGDTDDTA